MGKIGIFSLRKINIFLDNSILHNYNMIMQNTETVIVKIIKPNKCKAKWLSNMADIFSQAVQLGLNSARELSTSSRGKIHKAVYYPARTLGLSSDYARMSINAAVSLSRSFFQLRKKQKNTKFPKVNGSQGIGLGINAYSLTDTDRKFSLRCSTGKRGQYIWLPLCVPEKFKNKMQSVKGDAKLFQRNNQWYAMLPVKTTPTKRSGDKMFIGIDLGIIRIATLSTPDMVKIFNGKEIRHKREHFADIRKRYQKHGRIDKVKMSKGHERRWMTDTNHKISKEIVDIAAQYDNPVICFEKLDGIRERARGSKRFNRMMASWAFRQLVNMTIYKARRIGIKVQFVDPRNTSKKCHKCGHISRSNRQSQANFRCTKCGYTCNADVQASRNIAAVGLNAFQQEASDMPRSKDRTELESSV